MLGMKKDSYDRELKRMETQLREAQEELEEEEAEHKRDVDQKRDELKEMAAERDSLLRELRQYRGGDAPPPRGGPTRSPMATFGAPEKAAQRPATAAPATAGLENAYDPMTGFAAPVPDREIRIQAVEPRRQGLAVDQAEVAAVRQKRRPRGSIVEVIRERERERES